MVDPVPAGGGMINNNTKIGFDSQNRPIVAYHKYDRRGTRSSTTRASKGTRVLHKTSSWTNRWAFCGQGTLVFEIQVEPVEVTPNGT